MTKELQSDWDNWRLSRETSVTSPQGNLALVETTWVDFDTTVNVDEILEEKPATVGITTLERKDFHGTLLAHGYRLWDSASEANLKFDHIDTFPFNPEWIIEGEFTTFGERKPVAFEYIRDNGGTRDLAVPGEISTVIKGVEYKLHAFDDDGVLLLVFGDPTNGVSTYAAGRFLFVETIPGTNKVLLNFNKAFVPPCGFSIHYNCPMPPQSNKISAAIEAGERKPIFRDGFQPH